MIQFPEGILGKALAVGICLVLAMVVYVAAVVPVIGWYQESQRSLQERLDMVQRLDNSARDLPRLRNLAAEEKDGTAANPLFTEASDTIAAASIQSTVKGLIESGGGKLTNSEILAADQPDDRYRRMRIRVSFTGDLPLLAAVLQGIGAAHPALFVDNLDVRANGGGSSDDDDESSPKLAIAFDVYGFRSL